MDNVATGMEIANHSSQDKGGFIDPKAIKFWGDEIGEARPPIFDARAIAIYYQPCSIISRLTIRHLEKTDFGCNSFVIGLTQLYRTYQTHLDERVT